MIKKKIYKDLEKVKKDFINSLGSYSGSEIIQKFFLKRFKNDYPEFDRIFTEIEKYIDIDQVEIYLSNTQKELANSSKSDESFSNSLITKILEVYIQKKKDLPTGKIM